MSQAATIPRNALWRVRNEDATGEGHAVDFPTLTRAISDGILGENHEVRGPRDAQWVPIGDHLELAEYVPWTPIGASRTYDEADMDMTPMIDVTFQLLIFFMITACFVVQKTLDMPSAHKSEATAKRYTMSELQKNNVMVAVKSGGTVTVDGKPAELGTVGDAVREATRGRNNVEMVLDAEDAVEHETVVQVIDAAAGAQIEKVHFLHRVPAGGEKTNSK